MFLTESSVVDASVMSCEVFDVLAGRKDVLRRHEARGDESGDVSLMAGYLGWWSVRVRVNLMCHVTVYSTNPVDMLSLASRQLFVSHA